MRIPDELKKTVFFLCVEDTKTNPPTMKYGGTGFFVSVPSEADPDMCYVYLVTAKHCIKQSEDYNGIFARVNTKDGAKFIRITSEWLYPENEAVDLAITDMLDTDDTLLYNYLPLDMFATKDAVAKAQIGIGEELFILGLFTRHYGKEQNIPVLRSGVLAAMPQEPLDDVHTGLQYEAYLAEVRSIGGLSGSPVLVYPDVRFTPPGPPSENEGGRGAFYLLGLIRGHWDSKAASALDFADDERKAVNMGMAIVTPANELDSLLHREDLVKERRKEDRKILLENAPALDSAFDAEPVKPESFQRFENAVRQILSVSKEEIDERAKQEERTKNPPALD